MQRALYIGEIQGQIFGYLEREDLAQLARSSRFFFDVATDELWKTLNNFNALIRCLPPDFAERPLQPNDIQRLDLYTSKVQHLILEGKDNSDPMRLPRGFNRTNKEMEELRHKKSWIKLWEEIATIRPTSEAFRNLRTIRIDYVVEELFRPLIGISGLRITKIYIKHFQERQENSVIRQVLAGFQDVSNLEYLFVRDGRYGYIPRDLIQKAPLNHLRLDPPKRARRRVVSEELDILVDVLQKSTLQHLTIGLDSGWSTPEIQALKTKYLPSLKTLWLDLTKDKTLLGKSCPTFTSQPSNFSGWGCGCPPEAIAGQPAKDLSQSPVTFLEGLAAPELQILNIKFPVYTTGKMLIDFVSAVKSNCSLNNLTELSLSGGGASGYLDSYRSNIGYVTPAELWAAIRILLPLPRLKFLRISVAPGIFNVLDPDLFRSITEGLQGLETIWVGCLQYSSRYPWYEFQHRPNPLERFQYSEEVPIKNLAAFSRMLPNLVNVSVGSVTLEDLDPNFDPEFNCPNIETIRILKWYRVSGYTSLTEEQRICLHNTVRKYFPSARQELGLSDKQWFFLDGKWTRQHDDGDQLTY